MNWYLRIVKNQNVMDSYELKVRNDELIKINLP